MLAGSDVDTHDVPIVSDPLFDQILKFNLFPAGYTHISWLRSLEQITGGVSFSVAPTSDNPYWMRRLSCALLEWSEMDRQYDFDFTDRSKRLALLDQNALIQVGQHVGAVLAQPHLRKVVLRDQIRALNDVIGEDLRQFGLRWSASNPPLPMELSSLSKSMGKYLFTAEHWQRCAMRLMLSVMPDAASGIRGRLLLKFPYLWRHTKPFRLAEDQRKELMALCFVVVKQILPQWYGQLRHDTLQA